MALYDTIGTQYASHRRPDPRIAAVIDYVLADAQSVVNVGAGAGSYEPENRTVLAIEPSQVMIGQRSPQAAACVQGSADALPVESKSVDAAMTVLSAHHWPSLESGLREMFRVARKRVVMLTWVPPPDGEPFWLTKDYFPEILAHDRTIFPSSTSLVESLSKIAGESCITLLPVPIPHDCVDGFLCAYWRRPECYLQPEVRAAISSFTRIDARAGLSRLYDDLASGRWMQNNAGIVTLDSLDLGYRVVTCEIS